MPRRRASRDGHASGPPVSTDLLAGARPNVDAAIGEACTACVLRVERGGIGETYATGSLDPEGDDAPCTSGSLFDLASLTKIATAALALTFVREGKLAFETPFADVVAEFEPREPTLLQVLTHTAGLEGGWVHLYREATGLGAMVARAAAVPLAHPPGTAFVYSDLGYIMLSAGLARLGGKPFARLVEQRVLGPLGIAPAEMRYLPDDPSRCVATERDPWRGRRLRGEVHDENAYAMGGVAGHAGLFGTARAASKLIAAFRDGAVIGGELASLARREHAVDRDGARYGIGLQLKTREGSSLGRYFSADSYGHTGFTGTSVFVDPERDLTVVLLANRVYFGRQDEPIRRLRIEVHEALTR